MESQEAPSDNLGGHEVDTSPELETREESGPGDWMNRPFADILKIFRNVDGQPLFVVHCDISAHPDLTDENRERLYGIIEGGIQTAVTFSSFQVTERS